MDDIVYLNGHYLEKKNATISIMDRGFLFGDSIYEVIPADNGKLIAGREHYDRMTRSLTAILMDNPFPSYDSFKTVCHELLQRNKATSSPQMLYFQISRGAEAQRFHRIPDNLQQTVVGFCQKLNPHSKDELEKGFTAITHHDRRHDNNFIKSTTLLSNVLLLEKAREQGAIETILLRDGNVLECTASNLFIVKDNVVMTPKLSELILEGVTRGLILKFAKEAGFETTETDISESMLNQADEVWVTGSTKEICPIVNLNGNPVNDGNVGPVWHQINKLYQQYKEHSE